MRIFKNVIFLLLSTINSRSVIVRKILHERSFLHLRSTCTWGKFINRWKYVSTSSLIFVWKKRFLGKKWLSTRLISGGLELVLSHTEKSCIVSYYRQFFTNIKIKLLKLKPVLLVPRGRSPRLLSNYFFYFNIHRRLSLIRWDK